MFRSLGRAALGRFLGSLVSVQTDEKVAALTFDDGPDPESTPLLLDILGAYDAKATFFMLGEGAARNPALVSQVAESGHEIGNHTFSHPDSTEISLQQFLKETRKADAVLAPFVRPIFRPPFGFINMRVRVTLKLMQKTVVKWNVTTEDHRQANSLRILERLNSQIMPGSIVLLHDSLKTRGGGNGSPNRAIMLEAVKEFLKERHGEYEFVTVSEMLRRGLGCYQWWNRKAKGVK